MKKSLLLFGLFLLTIASCKTNDDVKPANLAVNKDDKVILVAAAYKTYKVIAGSTNMPGFTNGNGSKARFNYPIGIWVNPDGSLLVSDRGNNVIRKIKADSIVTTLNFPKTSNNRTLTQPGNLAVTADGTIGIANGDGIWFYKANNTLTFYQTNFHETIGTIDADPTGRYFWFTNNYQLGYTAGDDVYEGKKDLGIASDESLGSVDACPNGKKYVTTYRNIYTLNADGTSSHILASIKFQSLYDLSVNNDGSIIYVIDNGDIKKITNCSGCLRTISTLATGTKASNLALSNSEQYLYFTSSVNHTINKLKL
ncbi:hypothetical protein A0256_00740 [Mucilaginibacter sp. PAMC 26640]|nr:hypothetical protein A0256_00740 [Mucilaginibacter sp. PAMC 26640]